MKRWHVTIWYRTDNGPVDVLHEIEELDELAGIVEIGPMFDTIENIVITLQRSSGPGLQKITVEKAREM